MGNVFFVEFLVVCVSGLSFGLNGGFYVFGIWGWFCFFVCWDVFWGCGLFFEFRFGDFEILYVFGLRF